MIYRVREKGFLWFLRSIGLPVVFKVSSITNKSEFFKMAANVNSNSDLFDLSLDKNDPVGEAQSLGVNLSVPDKAVISGNWKIQTNPAGKSRSNPGKNDPKVSAWQRVQ